MPGGAAVAFQDSLQLDDEGEPPSPARLLSSRSSGLEARSPIPGPALPREVSSSSESPAGDEFSAEIQAGLGWVAGSAIALLSVLIPVASVVLDRAAGPQADRSAPAEMIQSLSVNARPRGAEATPADPATPPRRLSAH